MKITEQDLISYFEKKFGKEGISLSSSLTNDLGMDSLDQAEMVIYLEDILGEETPEEVAENFRTVQDVWDYIQSKQQ
jgi:acyl carrier protein